MPRRRKAGRHTGRLLLAGLVAVAAVAAGAWLAGWKPAVWEAPGIGRPQPAPLEEGIGPGEREALERVLRERSRATGD